jgi:hypothetical protein
MNSVSGAADVSGRRPGGDAVPWGALPEEFGAVLRPRLDELVAAVIAGVRAEVPEYDQPMEGEFGRLISQGVTVALEQFVDLVGRPVQVENLRIYEALGRAEHRADRTLDALQSAYRVGARVAWRHVAALGEEHGFEARTMYRVAEAIFAYIDRIAAASVAGYTQEQSVRAGSLQARRHALVELLVRRPPADAAEIEQAAQQAGWTPPTTLAALAVGGTDAVALARRMPTGTIGAALEPVALLLVPDPDGPGRAAEVAAGLRRARGVIGPTVPWAEAYVSAARATAAWPLHAAGRLGDAGFARADDHLLALLLVADRRLAADLVESRLGALSGLTPAARTRAIKTLRAWLDAHGDVSATAAALQVHPQTVRYRLAGLRQELGPALDDPDARVELELALRVDEGHVSASAGSAPFAPPPGKA